MPSKINETGKVVEVTEEDNGKTPLLPPTYSDAIDVEAHTLPKAKKSSSSNTADMKDDVNDRSEQFVSNLDPENPEKRWKRSKCSSISGWTVAQLVKFVTILLSLGFIVHAVKTIHQRNVCNPPCGCEGCSLTLFAER